SELKKYDIKKIYGNIYSDPSFFDAQTDRFDYSGDFDVVQKTQPITSIAIEKNILKVVVTAGAIYGRSVSVQVFPSSDAIKVYNNAKVGRNFGEHRYYRSFNYDGYGGGALISQRKNSQTRQQDRSFKVSTEKDKFGNQIIVVSGYLPAGTTKTYEFFIENPPLVVAGALKRRLESAGLEVLGNTGIVPTPMERSRPLAIVERNLVEVLKEMNKESDNYLAETVFKIVGAVDKKMTSNSKEAVRYIFSLIDSLKIPCSDCKIYDGSGLSRRNRLSPESILRILVFLKTNPNTMFIDTLLSVAGFDGTLKNRMVNSSAQGKIFAKTGTHSNASGLAGFARTLDNERIIFVFMYNGEKVFLFKKVEDQLCKILAEFFFSNTLE
ncbi:MAG: D-alanyl-D-alanine carboxypeptidase/D-alanyl-D-alanine-endopeptidase, partial [Candidatus Kapaibacteriota bacterium]